MITKEEFQERKRVLREDFQAALLKLCKEFEPAPTNPAKINCRKKVRYDTEEMAQQAARRFSQRVYRCPFCRDFHLTSKRKGGGSSN